jgi:peptide/nickel transport system permease protein
MSMMSYITRRVLFTIVVLIAISIVSFVVIQLPPGNYIATYIDQLRQQGTTVNEATIASLEAYYGLNEPVYVQYLKWMERIIFHGDFGRSFQYSRPVLSLLEERLPITVALQLMALVVTWIIAIPVGIYSATHQYQIGDFFFTALAFIGMAIPGFLMALLLLWGIYLLTGQMQVGLFSMEFRDAPWSWAKLGDFLSHLFIPLIVIGLSSTAGMIRVMRGVLLDELRKPYVITARAKGMSEFGLLMKYPVRVALNPIISGTAGILPHLVSGGTIIEIVLGLPTIGPLLFSALLAQDMFMAGAIVMLLSAMTVLGVMFADILLIAADPRIRFS